MFTLGNEAMYPSASSGDIVYTKKAENIKVGDFLLIDNPLDKKHSVPRKSLQRCVALSGDKIQIFSKRLYINDVLQNSDYCSFDTKILLLNDGELDAAHKLYKLFPDDGELVNTVLVVPEKLRQRIVSDSVLHHVDISVVPPYMADRKLFPYSRYFNWNKDFYGPVVVPAKGMKIKLDVANYVFYKYIFDNSEKCDVQYHDGQFIVDGKPAQTYTFRHNYYFLLNDYRDDPSDSRTFGPVCEDDIRAKATTFVLRHNDGKKEFFVPVD
ncbi:MAG: hypothetical protein IKS00_02740 [Bacteroidales bacterium]|nr:hypothetical protein [Bacteroidales bacterium]